MAQMNPTFNIPQGIVQNQLEAKEIKNLYYDEDEIDDYIQIS